MSRTLREYQQILEAEGLLQAVQFAGNGEQIVRQITFDSKNVEEGALFVCKGAAFKKQYLEDALGRGAFGYVSEKDYEIPGVPALLVKDIRQAMPPIARLFYAIPEDFQVIGITGTKGKTTTSYYLKAVLDEAMEELHKPPVGFMTTVETWDGKERISSGITTPEAFEIYRHFRNAYDSGIRCMVMEVSSQALKYRRVEGVPLDTAVFLNISEDHISPIEHPDFEDYFQSKLMIFRQCKKAVICTDSPYAVRIGEAAKEAETIVRFGFAREADVQGFDVREQNGKMAFQVKTDAGEEAYLLGMRGTFNVENALAVIAVARLLKLPAGAVHRALTKVSVPGRGEEFSSADGKLQVIVDYAHNGFSVRSMLEMARKSWPDRKIVSVFGCTGGKAVNRRKDMGLAAGAGSDFIYLTADDPAKERVEDICEEIGSWVDQTGCSWKAIPDRKSAVREAILSAKEPSVILVLGKGIETAQKTAKGSEPYESDPAVVKEALHEYDTKMEGEV